MELGDNQAIREVEDLIEHFFVFFVFGAGEDDGFFDGAKWSFRASIRAPIEATLCEVSMTMSGLFAYQFDAAAQLCFSDCETELLIGVEDQPSAFSR